MNSVTSGELYFRLCENKFTEALICLDFLNYLQHDPHLMPNMSERSRRQKQWYDPSLKLFKHSRSIRAWRLHRLLEVSKRIILTALKNENTRIISGISALRGKYDRHLMNRTLTYFSLLSNEMVRAQNQLQLRRADKEFLLRQARTIRNIKLFGCHLVAESKGRLKLTVIPSETQQFARCVKAVVDNLNPNIFGVSGDDLRSGINVLNVLKVQNEFLASKLQSLAREVFSPVWYAGEAAQGVPMNRDTSYLAKVSGFAAKRSTLFDKPIALRFSRFSSVSQIKEYDPEELQNGVFLSLCRVLILHQRSVVGPITDTDIQEALAMNYDSVYSTLTEEYVLLQPKFVLPEFFMQVQFPRQCSSRMKQPSFAASPPTPDLRVAPNLVASALIAAPYTNSCSDVFESSTSQVGSFGNAPAMVNNVLMTNELEMYQESSRNIKSGQDETLIRDIGEHPRELLTKKREILASIEDITREFRKERLQHMKEYTKNVVETALTKDTVL